MKRILSIIIPLAAVMALMAPGAAFGQQPTPTPKPKGGGGGPPQGFKPQITQPTQPIHKPVVTSTPPPKVNYQKSVVQHTAVATPTPGPKYHKPVVNNNISNTSNAVNTKNVTKNAVVNKNTNTNMATQGQGQGKPQFKKGGQPGSGQPLVINNKTFVHKTPSVVQNKSWSGPKGGGKFNRANNFGGHWVDASAVPSGWSHYGDHDWHGHHYRWFNGGWLIVDNGFWPAGYYPLTGGSKMWNAQAELANMGYYDGEVDGVAGPETREAIANFQSDNDLPVDGHLNPPTQVALGLEPPDYVGNN
ncbi:MAG TPA: peptidoglycan-binding domain-containing protein [Verrucomicrobiae bacterium]|nr:peptidoglycan-binding domain-containing protein [Verrucomicrobiae bacterium]